MVWVSLVMAAAVAGPPKLPPMPGQSAAPEPTPLSAKLPTQPKPAAPAPAAPTATAATPVAAPPSASTAAPATSPGSPPASATVPAPSFSGRDAEPPQPTVPAPRAPRDGEGASPRMGPAPLPGGDPEVEPAKKLPPPLRPPYRGIGLFVGASVSFGFALAEQIVAHVIVKRRCIEPVAEQAAMTDPFDSDTDAEEVGNAVITCVPGVLPVVALRVNSDIALLAMIGMATAGAIYRAERVAYDDAFASRKQARISRLRGAGIGLVAVGALTWLTMSPAAWGVLAKCDDAKCASRARVMGFLTRDAGAVLVASGAAMLGFSETYRRKHEHFSRERALLWAPTFGRGLVGISVQQRF